ncbi:MAG: hypothetical protein M3256_12985 [Actinomycetota bacterium]|nr:hypothetical protein [Actinomycetota bacterium]
MADASAEKGMDLGWERVTYGWLVNEPDPIAKVAKELTDFKTGLHSQVLGKPMESMMIGVGAPQPVALLFGKVAEAAGLPAFDGPLVAARRLVELGGIVVGVASGNMILTSACLKAFAHDELTHALAKALEAGFGHLGGVERSTQEVGPHEVDLYLEMTTPLIFEPPTAGLGPSLGPSPAPAAPDVGDSPSTGTSSQPVPAPPGKRSRPFEPRPSPPLIWDRPFSARPTPLPGAPSPPTPVDPGLGDPRRRPPDPGTDLSIT